MDCRGDQLHSPQAQTGSSSSRDSPSKTSAGLFCTGITMRFKLSSRTNSKKGTKKMRKSSALTGLLLMTIAFTIAPSAQAGDKDTSQAPGILPSGYSDAVDHDVMKVREATAKFKTTEAAEAAGYKRVTDCVEYKPHGAMGYHYQNNALLDTTLDLEHPEVLVYEKMADGSFQLNGVEFLVPISAWKSPEPPRIMGQALTKADSIGFWFLHVWTWKPSPTGLFAPWNPDVKCDGASSMHH
jgi:hypothetical protein